VTLVDILMRESSGLLAGLSQAAAGAFVASLWQGLVLAAGAWVFLRMVPRVTAAVRFAVWTAVFAVLALLPFLHAFGASASQPLAAHGAMLHVDVRWSFVIAGLWAAMSLARVAMLVAGAFRLRGIWKRATPVATAELPAFADGLRGVELCTSHDVDRPSVIGFFSPRILVPQEMFESLSPAELEHVVLHEMGHLRRRDDWINLAQKVGLALFPLNPVLMWIERRLCFERELACDDDVLRLTRAPKAYARCLTNLAEQRLERRSAALSLGAWERRSELGRRVHSILRGGEGMGRVQARVVLGVVVVAIVGGATALARCPRVVSFAGPEPQVQAAVPAKSLYEPVLSTAANVPHETLLKASAPAAVVPAVHRKARRAASGAVLQRAKRVEPAPVRVEQWVVMTSWSSSVSSSGANGVSRVSRMVFTVPGERGVVPAYAAVPTPDGWLVLQL